MDEKEISELQTFFGTLSDGNLEADPVLRSFKKAELVSTMAAAATGKYHEYWNLDRISDLNNFVDSDPMCDESLKALFGPKASRNPRLRGNRIGQLVVARMKTLREQGGPTMAAAPMAPAPLSPSAQPSAPAITASSGSTAALGPSSVGVAASTRYVFAHDMQPEAQLRIRAGPSVEAEVLGVITAGDEIFMTENFGDWLCVKLPGFPELPEAWVLCAQGDKQLLVPASPSAAGPMSQVPQPITQQPMVQEPPPQQPAYSQPAPVQPQQQYQQPPANNFEQTFGNGMGGGPRMSVRAQPAMQQPMGSDFMSESMRMSQMGMQPPMTPRSTANFGEMVPKSAYEVLERRLAALETEVHMLKQLLRSV
eukprot:m.198956 g.198956  ORF g.198956 m.198956 type:complete len:366 (-) comp18381_c0_seq12:106-1203(-)